jgi:hypothetical protein
MTDIYPLPPTPAVTWSCKNILVYIDLESTADPIIETIENVCLSVCVCVCLSVLIYISSIVGDTESNQHMQFTFEEVTDEKDSQFT